MLSLFKKSIPPLSAFEPAEEHPNFIHTTLSRFRANMPYYIDRLKRGGTKGIILHRYKKAVGVFIVLEDDSDAF